MLFIVAELDSYINFPSNLMDGIRRMVKFIVKNYFRNTFTKFQVSGSRLHILPNFKIFRVFFLNKCIWWGLLQSINTQEEFWQHTVGVGKSLFHCDHHGDSRVCFCHVLQNRQKPDFITTPTLLPLNYSKQANFTYLRILHKP